MFWLCLAKLYEELLHRFFGESAFDNYMTPTKAAWHCDDQFNAMLRFMRKDGHALCWLHYLFAAC